MRILTIARAFRLRALLAPLPTAFVAALAAVASSAAHAQLITPSNPGAADLQFTVSSAASKSISPYIYGMNFYNGSSYDASNSVPVTLDRLGGNRWTGYNWETNASNAGADYYHHSDYYLTGGVAGRPPGYAVQGSLTAAAAENRALIVTLPMAGYVAADAAGTVDETQVAPSSRWKQVQAKKSTIYPGQPLATAPNASDGYVFTDEFVNRVETWKAPGQQVFYSLDNEPGLWGEALPPGWQSGVEGSVNPSAGGRTHPLIHPYAPTFAEMRDKTIAHAGAIKDVNPSALVFGGVGYGWNDFVSLQDAPDAAANSAPAHPGGDQSGEMHFNEYLLKQVAQAEVAQGRTLMDVLDLHWYPEAQGGGVRVTENNNSTAVAAARVQAPRSLWDPTYVETSWISQWGTWQGSPGNPGPVRLLPRVQRDIDDFKPGTKIAITEYNYGGTNHISGAVAQADALGAFGQQNVFAATFWSLYSEANSQFAAGAFKMYLNYDGAGGSFGDEAITAATSNIADSAVYAGTDSSDATRMTLVAINRSTAPKSVGLAVTHDRRFDIAEVYRLTSASPNPVRVADIEIGLVNAFQYSMPAMSITTLVLRSFIDGDFNGNGVVNADDLAVWKSHVGMTSAHFTDGDADRDGDVDGADFLAWQRNLGAVAPTTFPTQSPVPEPATLTLALTLLSAVTIRRRVSAPGSAGG